MAQFKISRTKLILWPVFSFSGTAHCVFKYFFGFDSGITNIGILDK